MSVLQKTLDAYISILEEEYTPIIKEKALELLKSSREGIDLPKHIMVTESDKKSLDQDRCHQIQVSSKYIISIFPEKLLIQVNRITKRSPSGAIYTSDILSFGIQRDLFKTHIITANLAEIENLENLMKSLEN